jgi:hypothetical protein
MNDAFATCDPGESILVDAQRHRLALAEEASRVLPFGDRELIGSITSIGLTFSFLLPSSF